LRQARDIDLKLSYPGDSSAGIHFVRLTLWRATGKLALRSSLAKPCDLICEEKDYDENKRLRRQMIIRRRRIK
jgi:hypothetical protein